MVIRSFEKLHFWVNPVSAEETQTVKPRRFNPAIRDANHDLLSERDERRGIKGFPESSR